MTPILTRIMPWTVANYYTYPYGGILNGAALATEYAYDIWNRLIAPGSRYLASVNQPGQTDSAAAVGLERANDYRQLMFDFAYTCLAQGFVEITTQKLPDGSVQLSQPKIRNARAVEELLLKTAQKFRSR
jgi:hypothetical protein